MKNYKGFTVLLVVLFVMFAVGVVWADCPVGDACQVCGATSPCPPLVNSETVLANTAFTNYYPDVCRDYAVWTHITQKPGPGNNKVNIDIVLHNLNAPAGQNLVISDSTIQPRLNPKTDGGGGYVVWEELNTPHLLMLYNIWSGKRIPFPIAPKGTRREGLDMWRLGWITWLESKPGENKYAIKVFRTDDLGVNPDGTQYVPPDKIATIIDPDVLDPNTNRYYRPIEVAVTVENQFPIICIQSNHISRWNMIVNDHIHMIIEVDARESNLC